MSGLIRQGLWGGAEVGGMVGLLLFFNENKHFFKINWWFFFSV